MIEPDSFSYSPRTLTAQEYGQAFENREAHSLIGPNNVLLQVNYSCYLQCKMCERHAWTEDGTLASEMLSSNELKGLFTQLSQLGTRRITLVGTEPVMRPDLPELIHSIRTEGMKPELYTAGIKLDQEVIDAVLDNGCDVVFSVDGLQAASHNEIRTTHKSFNAFHRTLSSICRLREARGIRNLSPKETKISANFTIQRGNIEDLRQVSIDDIDKLGVDVLRMSLVHGQGDYSLRESDITILRDFAERVSFLDTQTEVNLSSAVRYVAQKLINGSDLEKNVLIPSSFLESGHPTCHIGEYSTMIDPIGDVRPCIYLADDNGVFYGSDRDEHIMGNVRQSPFDKIWNGDKYTQFRNGNYPDVSDGSRCRTCEYMEDFDLIDQAITSPSQETIQIGW